MTAKAALVLCVLQGFVCGSAQAASFELNSKDGLRRVIFRLEKDTVGDDITWKINFKLFERDKKSDAFGVAVVSLDVKVDATLNNRAEYAAHNGLTPGQAVYALGPAADDVKGTKTGGVDEDEARQAVEATLTK